MKRFGTWIGGCIALSALVIAGTGVGQAGTLRTTDVPFRHDIRALGMGGAYVAAGRNGSAFLYNPALLNQSHVNIGLPISLGVDANAVDMFKFINDNQASLEGFSNLTIAQQEKLFRDMTKFDGEKIKFRVTPMFNIVMKNFGLAGYGAIKGGGGVDKGIFEPRIAGDGRIDCVVALGIAKGVSKNMAIGVTGKYINSRATDFRFRITQVGNTFDTVLDSLKSGDAGVALDVGMLYRLGERSTLGVVAQNIYGKVGNDKYPINLKAGLAWTSKRLTLAADLTDLLNKDGVSIFNRVFMGAEFRIPFISLRGGFYQGYPSIGAGLNLKIVKIDVAKYKIETGGRPGIAGLGQLEAQIKIGWGW